MIQEEIRSVIVEQVSAAHSVVSGCALGASLHDRFPGLNLRLQYGGLRRFIESHCADQVVLAGNRGKDDLYGIKGRVTFVRPLREIQHPNSPTPNRRANFWKIFSNPAFSGHLLYDPVSEKLIHSLTRTPELHGTVEIRRMNYEEQRGIARDFANSQMLPEHSVAGIAALEQPNYWPAWTKLINEANDRQYFYRWTSFRNDRIREMFFQRMKEHGLPDDSILRCLYKLSDYPSVTDVSSDATNRESDLRELARLALARMPDDELRKLMLPLGLIHDVLKDLLPVASTRDFQ